MKSMDWWYLDKKQRIFMATGRSSTHVNKGPGDWFIRRWHHKLDTKKIFISIKEQKEMGLKRITRKESRRLKKLNDTQSVRDFVVSLEGVQG